MTFTLESLEQGVIYKIASLAINDEGSSDLSDYILLASTELPPPPVNLYKEKL
jgi:hypothetical protein